MTQPGPQESYHTCLRPRPMAVRWCCSSRQEAEAGSSSAAPRAWASPATHFDHHGGSDRVQAPLPRPQEALQLPPLHLEHSLHVKTFRLDCGTMTDRKEREVPAFQCPHQGTATEEPPTNSQSREIKLCCFKPLSWGNVCYTEI